MLLIVGLCLFLFISLLINNKDSNDQLERGQKNAPIYSFIRDLELNAQEIVIPPDLLKKVVSNSFRLIFVYSGGECDKCIFEDIQMLKDKIGGTNIDKVIVLPIFKDSRRTNIELNADLEGLNYYRLDPLSVGLPQYNGFQVRFFCILSPKGELIQPFFPDIGDSDRTLEYLNFVEKEYLGRAK